MKKILIALAFGAVAYAGCKKKESVVSSIVTVSLPVVTITSPQYLSLYPGDALPTVTAVAYDTFYHDSLSVLVDYEGVDITTPGLYVVKASARNKYGHIGVGQVYVAVTDISDTVDISGNYLRIDPPATGRISRVSKLSRGLFMTDNLGGVDTADATGNVLSAVFAVIDTNTIDFGKQYIMKDRTWFDLTTTDESLTYSPVTRFTYGVVLTGFTSQVRTFVKQ